MILLTGFEPFDGATVNPTQRLVEHIAALELPDVAACVLSTSYRRAEVEVTAAVRQLQPRYVCMLGLNASATKLRFEQVALNLNQAEKPDNDGEIRRRQSIRDTGPVAYWNRLPLEPLQSLASASEEALETSRDAGGFVCNHVFYTVSDLLAQELPDSRAGFIHVPPLDELRFGSVCRLLVAWLEQLRQ